MHGYSPELPVKKSLEQKGPWGTAMRGRDDEDRCRDGMRGTPPSMGAVSEIIGLNINE